MKRELLFDSLSHPFGGECPSNIVSPNEKGQQILTSYPMGGELKNLFLIECIVNQWHEKFENKYGINNSKIYPKW